VFTEGMALGSAFLSSVSSVVITPVAKEGMALRLLVVRSGFAALFISVALLLVPAKTAFGNVTALGVGAILLVSGPVFGLAALVYYRGIQSLGLAKAYPVVNVFPLFSTLLAVLLLGERPHWLAVAGTVVILAGVWLVSSTAEGSRPQAPASTKASANKWIGLMIGTAVLFAISTTANKVALDTGLSPLLVNLGRMVCAGSMGVVASLARRRGFGFRTLPRLSWGRVAISSFSSDLVGHYLYFTAMQLGEVSSVVPLAATSPLFVIPMARVFLKEVITWPIVVGTFLAVCGIILVLAS
jgi:drug/metabolite transporter (DMT)-like permease